MKDYNKLSDQSHSENQNPHSLLTDQIKYDNAFFSNSPSSLKNCAINKSKLATIPELPSNLFKSKSSTEVDSKTEEKNQFDDNFINMNLNEDGNASDPTELKKNSANFKLVTKSITSNLYEPRNPLNNDFNLTKTASTQFIKTQTSKLPKELAVDVRNISYQYGIGRKATKVLNDITLRVPLGGIYGLLGPSGCGKTSLLKIVIGLHRPDQGLVRVFGQSPGINNSFIPGPGVGYMPQDISLFSDLTVAETLVFYSKIYRMKSHLVPDRIEFLLKLLDLTEKGNKLVKQLSGGQKRRVSLAAALVHSPPLVILDEPTVGVDPLLRQSIWEHLVRLAQETSLTVIITTHYIEEARQANTVGLMRFGRILVESNPDKLMVKYKQNNLEDVFLSLCQMDEKEFSNDSDNESDNEGDNDSMGQLRFVLDAVRYSATTTTKGESSSGSTMMKESNSNKSETSSSTNSKKLENDNNYDDEDIPKVVVSDFSLPISPHVVKEKENEYIEQQGIRFMNPLVSNQQQQQTPSQNKNKFNQLRSPLSPIEDKLEENNKLEPNDYLQVIKRERSDTSSSLGSSIIEYDSSIHSRDSCVTPIKLAKLDQEFKNTFEPKVTLGNRIKTSVHKIGALFYKNLTLLRRNIPLLLFQFFLPSIEIILFGICIGADPFNIPIGVFNQDTSGNLPQRFLSTIDNYTVTQIHYPSLQTAIEAARNGETWGAIAFKQNFSVALGERHMFSLQSDNETLDHSNIYIFLDMTNQLIGYKVQRTLYESFQKFTRDILGDLNPESNPAAVDLPIRIGKPIYGDRDPTFTEFMAPGVVLTIAFLATVAMTALAFVMERKDGIMERVLVSGVTPFEFLMSHVVTQLCVIVVQVALLLIFTFLVFDIPSRGPFIWVILLTMLQALCGMEYGLLISSLCESETAATMMALGSFYPNLLLSGTVWPTQAMPDFMRYFSYILPQTLPIESMRYILSRGWDPTYWEVSIGFAVTILWTMFFMFSTMLAFKRIK